MRVSTLSYCWGGSSLGMDQVQGHLGQPHRGPHGSWSLTAAPTKHSSLTSRCELVCVCPREARVGSRHLQGHRLRIGNFQSMNSSAPKADVSNRAGEKCYRNACFSQGLQREARQLAQTQMSALKQSAFGKLILHPIA